jgi:hypothetical protein
METEARQNRGNVCKRAFQGFFGNNRQVGASCKPGSTGNHFVVALISGTKALGNSGRFWHN